MIRTEKRIVKTKSEREAVLDLGAVDEQTEWFSFNYGDGTQTIRPSNDILHDIQTDDHESLESLQRTIINVDDKNVWTFAFELTICDAGFVVKDTEYILENLDDALASLNEAVQKTLDDTAARDKTLEVGIADQVVKADLDEVRELITSNTWSNDHCYLIPLLMAEIHEVEAWVHYDHLEDKTEPNVIRFKCSRNFPRMLCVLECKDNRFYATKKISSKPSPGDLFNTAFTNADQRSSVVRLIRRVTLKKEEGKTEHRYVVEKFTEGEEPQEFIMRYSTFKKMIARPVYDTTTPRKLRDNFSSFDALCDVTRRGSRAPSFLSKHPRISVISRADSINEWELDLDNAFDDEIWEYITAVNITSTHQHISEDINGYYESVGEDETINGFQYWETDNASGYRIFLHEDGEHLVVGKGDEQPLVRIHRDKIEVEIYSKYLHEWRPNVGDAVKLDYTFEASLPEHVKNAFNHLGMVARQNDLYRTGTVRSPMPTVSSFPPDTLATIEEDPGRSSLQISTGGSNDEYLPPTAKLTRGITETRQAEKFMFNKRVYLNQYCLGKELGEGAFGKVVFAIDTREMNRKVAIKIVQKPKKKKVGGRKGRFGRKGKLKGKKSGPSKEEQQYNREIAIMKKINHPNCVCLYELIDDSNRQELFMVLEYVDGGTLKEVQKPLKNMREIRSIFTDVLKGIQYLHHQRISHSDLKPANVLMTKDGRAKVCDFGTSLTLGSGNSYVSFAMTTPSYKSPEVIQYNGGDINGDNMTTSGGLLDIPKRCFKPWPGDIWACGVILLELVTGVNPFHVANDIDETERRIREYDPFGDPGCECWSNADAMPREINENIKQKFQNSVGLNALSLTDDGDEFSLPEINDDMSSGFDEINDLIRKMLDKDPKKRIGLDGITHHVWITDYHKTPWSNDLETLELDMSEQYSVGNEVIIRQETAYDKNPLDSDKADDALSLTMQPSKQVLNTLGVGYKPTSTFPLGDHSSGVDTYANLLHGAIDSPQLTSVSYIDSLAGADEEEVQPDTERDSVSNNFIIYRPSTPDNSSGNFDDDLIGSLDGGDILSEDDKNLPMSGSVIISSPGDLPDFNNPEKTKEKRRSQKLFRLGSNFVN